MSQWAGCSPKQEHPVQGCQEGPVPFFWQSSDMLVCLVFAIYQLHRARAEFNRIRAQSGKGECLAPLPSPRGRP